MKLFTQLIARADSARALLRVADIRQYSIRFALLACTYYAAVKLSRYFAIPPGFATPLWPPAAIGLCACLLWGLRVAPAIWLGAMLANRSSGMAFATVLATGAAFQACVAAALMRHTLHGPPDFTHHDKVFRFIGVAAVSNTIGATVGTATLALTHPMRLELIAQNWLTWWHGGVSGMIIFTPLLLSTQVVADLRRRPAAQVETGVFALLLLATMQLAFSNAHLELPLAYLPLPFLLWAAFRLGPGIVAWSTAAVCAIAVWYTAHGSGPFITGSMNTALLLALTYVSVLGTTGMIVAGLAHQRRQAECRLQNERCNLERRVNSRTKELVADIETRKRIERQLAERERQLAEAQRLTHVGSWNWDLGSGKIIWSDELYRILGLQKGHFDITATSCRALIHEEDLDRLQHVVHDSRQSGAPFHVEHRVRLRCGSVKTVSARGYAEKDEAGRVVRMFGTVQDITEAKQVEACLREAEQRYRTLVEVSPDAILVLQDGEFVFANHAAYDLLRAQRSQQLIGKPLFHFTHPDFHELARERNVCLARGQPLPATEEKFIRTDGTIVDVEVNASPFRHQGRPAVLLIVRDITERKKNLEHVVRLAHYDALTGLPNRILLHQRLDHALALAVRPGRSLELLFLDLDRFKSINDTMGHAAGDHVLQEAAARLQGTLRESDTVARMGGDEFVVLLENVDGQHWGSIIARKILAAFRPPFLQKHKTLNIGVSIGIAVFPADGTDADTLLKHADIAMYRAKETGSNTYRYYSPQMDRRTEERQSFACMAAHAKEHDQMAHCWQPQVDLRLNRITGAQALLRRQSSKRR